MESGNENANTRLSKMASFGELCVRNLALGKKYRKEGVNLAVGGEWQ